LQPNSPANKRSSLQFKAVSHAAGLGARVSRSASMDRMSPKPMSRMGSSDNLSPKTMASPNTSNEAEAESPHTPVSLVDSDPIAFAARQALGMNAIVSRWLSVDEHLEALKREIGDVQVRKQQAMLTRRKSVVAEEKPATSPGMRRSKLTKRGPSSLTVSIGEEGRSSQAMMGDLPSTPTGISGDATADAQRALQVIGVLTVPDDTEFGKIDEDIREHLLREHYLEKRRVHLRQIRRFKQKMHDLLNPTTPKGDVTPHETPEKAPPPMLGKIGKGPSKSSIRLPRPPMFPTSLEWSELQGLLAKALDKMRARQEAVSDYDPGSPSDFS